MYLANALIVLAIMALVIPAVLFVAYIIGAATLPPIFNAVNNATPNSSARRKSLTPGSTL